VLFLQIKLTINSFKESAMKTFKNTLSILTLLVSGICTANEQDHQSTITTQPNFIVILTDDQGYADVGFNGSKDIRTPNIDRIANEGTKFTNGYVSYAVCGPSRAGLLTGRYQGRFGFGRNPVLDPTDSNAGMPLEEQMISEVLKPVGYTSSIIGKWHMGLHPKFHPNKRGFEHFYGFLNGGHDYLPERLIHKDFASTPKGGRYYATKLNHNGEVVEIDEYLTDELSHEAVNFIEREQDNPFFLYLAYNAPHGPMQATQNYLDRNKHIKDKKRQTYAAMITAVDDGVGRVLNKLKELGIDDNTLVFFLSDNGGSRKHPSSNAPLRGHKSDYFEGGIHVPFAVRWPNKIPAGQNYENPVSSLDILGTFAALAQAPIAKERPLDGVNLMPFITGDDKGLPHEVLFWRNFDQGTLATRRGDSKIIHSKTSGDHLYNLQHDLAETTNLIDKDPTQFEQQKLEVKTWEKSLIDPVFRPLKMFKNKKSNKNQ
jgi:arylsulfatase A-like enzyme